MAKQLNVNLAFTADTSQAKAQIKDLQNQLTNLINQPASGMNNGIASNIKEATNAAAELKVHLENATNVKTGTLDFSRLSQSIKASGKDLNDYAAQLKNMGPAGQKAFMSLASAIAQSEVPIRRSNAMLKEFATTLKNTARWQLSSSILHGFMGSLSSAYGYAQRLNESLNNIQIVTGRNSEQMAAFAEQANKAAKALSTTTTEYTDASLIYFQQGLDEAQVQERADITIKMAHASGQSAQLVSDQLTAVWNNFAKGGENLEYYADVMTALGAATASSSDEIAGGLEKFASIADMIGLSYEYAATALATITATTRQSEDVVGTALKTIFARIQGLSLGETLEDGTDLNKYSQALEKVGISIFEQNGELKQMDSILNEIGGKWETLSDDQQVALAQTVAGVRQYNQLVSLFDNWDYFNENLDVAMSSTGELSKQAKIYEESWQAASDRVRAAMEGIYSKLVDDDFFIGLLNTIEKIISAVDGLIGSMGGFAGVLATVGAISTKVFSKQMAQGLRDMAYNLKMSTESGRQQVQQEKSKTLKNMADMMYDEDDNAKGRIGSELYQQQLIHQQQMIDNANQLTEAEARHLQILLDQEKALSDIAIKSAEEKDKKQSELDETAMNLKRQGLTQFDEDGNVKNSLEDLTDQLGELRNGAIGMRELDQMLLEIGDSGDLSADQIEKINQALKKIHGPDFDKTISGFDELEQAIRDSEFQMNRLRGRTIDMFGPQSAEMVDNYVQQIQEVNAAEEKMVADRERAKNSGQGYEEALAESSSNIDIKIDWADRIVAGADAVASTISVFQMLGSVIDTIKDPDMTGWEKFVAILTSVSMAVPMVAMTITSLKTAFGGLTVEAISNTAAQLADAAATFLNTQAKRKLGEAAEESANALDEEEEELYENMYAQEYAAGKTDGNKGEIKDGDDDNKNSKLKDSFNNLKEAAQNFYRAYKTIINGFLKGAGIIAAVSAALAIASAHYHRFEAAARKAGEALEEANQAFSHAQGAYNEFSNTVTAYEDAVSGMDSLVYGTNEYREAVINANDEALKLIDTIDGLQYSVNDDGLIIIDEESLERAKQTQLEILETAQAAKIQAQQNKKTADLEVDKATFMRDNMKQTSLGMSLITENEEKAIDALVEAYGKDGNAVFGNIERILKNAGLANYEALAASLNENIGATQALIAALYANAEAQKASQAQMAKNAFGEEISKSGLSATSQEDLAVQLGADIAAETTKQYDSMFNAGAAREAGGKRMTNQEVADAYAAAMGYSSGKAKVFGDKSTYYDAEGNEIGDISNETARQFLAQQAALQSVQNTLDNTIASFSEVARIGNSIGDGMGDILTGITGSGSEGLGQLNKSELARLEGSVGKYDTKSDSFMLGNQEITREIATDLGFRSVKAYRNAIIEAVDDAQSDLTNAGKNLAEAPQKAFNKTIERNRVDTVSGKEEGDPRRRVEFDTGVFDSLSADATRSLAAAFGTVYENAGDAGVKYLQGFIHSLDDETAKGMAEAMEGIDWSDWRFADQLKANLEELDVAINPAVLDAFIAKMRELNNSVSQLDITTFAQKMAEVQAILDGLTTGDTIDEETYNKIMEASNGAAAEYFNKMNDGTYKLVGAAETLAGVVDGINMDTLKEEVAAQQSVIADAQEKSSQGYAALNGYSTEDIGQSAYRGMGAPGETIADNDLASAQIDYAEAMGTVDADQAEKWREMIASGEAVSSTYRKIADAARDAKAAHDELNGSVGTAEEALLASEMAMANSAQSFSQLMDMNLISNEAFVQGMQNVAASYENCREELDALIAAQQSGNAAQITAAENDLYIATRAGEAAAAYGVEASAIEDVARSMLEMADAGEEEYQYLKDSPELASDAATRYVRLQEAIEDLKDNYEEYGEELTKLRKTEDKLDKANLSNSETFKKLKKSLANLLDTSEEFMDVDFLDKLDPKDLEKAAKGDEKAIERIQDAFTDYIQEVNAAEAPDMFKTSKEEAEAFKQTMDSLEDGAVLDLNDQPFLTKLIYADLQAGMTMEQIQAKLSGLGIDMEISGYYNTLAEAQAAADACGGSIVDSMSFSQEAEAVSKPSEGTTETVSFNETYQTAGTVTANHEVLLEGATETVPIQSTYTNVKKVVTPVKESESWLTDTQALNVKTTNGKGKTGGQGRYAVVKPAKSSGGRAAPSSKGGGSSGGGGGGGGGGKSTPAKRPTRTHKREVWNPFRDTTKALERIADAMEDVEKRIDRLYGKNRVEAINKVNQALQAQIAKLKEQKVIAQDELKYDKAWLNQIAKENDLGDNAFTFDETQQGAVSNYSKIMKPLWDKLHEIEDVRQKWFKEGKTEEAIEAEMERLGYDDLQTRISNVEAALGVYDESVEKLREVENAIADAFYEWQDNNYDKLHYTLELKIEVEEMDLAYIEYMLDKMSDDFWSMAEAAKQMVLSVDNYERILEADEAFYNDLNTAYMHGEISQEAYLEGLKETFDNILDTLSSLNQLDKDMLEYYANSLDAASDELAHYTDQLEHLTDVLDHYRNVIEMVNGEFAYDQIDTVLRGQSQTIKNELDVATKTYEMLQREKEAIEASLATAEDDAAAKVFQEELMAIEESLMEAHANMLDKTESWAEIELEIFENTMAKAARTMELAMTDNMGFDSLSNSIDRLSSYAEVYLTKTNQIYEMQTLINKATTESDKITNKAAQNRLQAFIKETEALKEKNQLSNLELDIQKAKYELLLAEIALEEAQNAKATVRLKRDSEGNFGYVYTADQEAIGEAEQEVLDAQNRLYNIGLDGANEYGEKMLQLRQEHADALIDLEERRAAGEFKSDELYNAEKERINREYYALMEAYSEQYTIALGVHNAIQEDAWVNAYEGMITKTDEWQLAVVEYTINCETAFSDYKKTLKDGSDIIKTALDDIKTVTGEVTDESDRLAREIQNDLLPHMKDQLIAVREQTTAYAEQRDTILDLIDKYEKLADTIRGQVREQSTMDSTNDIKDYSYEMSKIIASGEKDAMNSERFKQLSNARVEKIATEGTTQDWIEHDTLLKLFEAAENGNEKAMNYVKAIANKEAFYNNEEAKKILGLATGGYTGAWGSEGRIALLHEKELVLNASDTSNFLKALDIMREITKSIDLENLRQQYAFAINSIPSIGQGFAETIEQNVHIEASFPAVQDRNEIEEAFNNLINTASQFANRKKL